MAFAKDSVSFSADPPNDLVRSISIDLCKLICETRVPVENEHGFEGGPHSPMVSTAHSCDLSATQCLLSQFNIERLLNSEDCFEVEVLLLSECCMKDIKSLLTDKYGGAPYILIENWTVTFKSIGEVLPLMNSKQLLRAVHSFLHFSQLSAWLRLSKGKVPKCIFYRVRLPNDPTRKMFDISPKAHTFPLCAVTDTISAEVKVLHRPRSEIVPRPTCVFKHNSGCQSTCKGSDLGADISNRVTDLKDLYFGNKEAIADVQESSHDGHLLQVKVNEQSPQKQKIHYIVPAPKHVEKEAVVSSSPLLIRLRGTRKRKHAAADDGGGDVCDNETKCQIMDYSPTHTAQCIATVQEKQEVPQIADAFNASGIKQFNLPSESMSETKQKQFGSNNSCHSEIHTGGGEGSSSVNFNNSLQSDAQGVTRRKFPSWPVRPPKGLDIQTNVSYPAVWENKEAEKPKPLKTEKFLQNFEETMLHGGFRKVGTALGYRIFIQLIHSFRTNQLQLPVDVSFHEIDGVPTGHSPLLGVADISDKFFVPKKGLLRVVMVKPCSSVLQEFKIGYDFTDMPPMCQTFVRQRVYCIQGPKKLCYLINIWFESSKSGKLFLTKNVKVVALNSNTVREEKAGLLHTETEIALLHRRR